MLYGGNSAAETNPRYLNWVGLVVFKNPNMNGKELDEDYQTT